MKFDANSRDKAEIVSSRRAIASGSFGKTGRVASRKHVSREPWVMLQMASRRVAIFPRACVRGCVFKALDQRVFPSSYLPSPHRISSRERKDFRASFYGATAISSCNSRRSWICRSAPKERTSHPGPRRTFSLDMVLLWSQFYLEHVAIRN